MRPVMELERRSGMRAGNPARSSTLIGLAASWRAWRLRIQRLPVLDAAPDEFRPGRNDGNRIGLLWQQPPKARMMPAEVVKLGVAVLPNAVPQHPHFFDQLLARHPVQVVIHGRWASNDQPGSLS